MASCSQSIVFYTRMNNTYTEPYKKLLWNSALCLLLSKPYGCLWDKPKVGAQKWEGIQLGMNLSKRGLFQTWV